MALRLLEQPIPGPRSPLQGAGNYARPRLLARNPQGGAFWIANPFSEADAGQPMRAIARSSGPFPARVFLYCEIRKIKSLLLLKQWEKVKQEEECLRRDSVLLLLNIFYHPSPDNLHEKRPASPWVNEKWRAYKPNREINWLRPWMIPLPLPHSQLGRIRPRIPRCNSRGIDPRAWIYSGTTCRPFFRSDGNRCAGKLRPPIHADASRPIFPRRWIPPFFRFLASFSFRIRAPSHHD